MKRHFAIKISGRVQGVGFRYYAKNIANNLQLKGFVKNKPDGSVYIEAEGEEDLVQHFIEWCNKGPDRGMVENVVVEEGTLKNFSFFEVTF